MNQTFDLNRMGFTEMQNEELQFVDGGKMSALDVVSTVGLGLAVVGMVCTGPVAIAAAIVGGEMGAIATICSWFN